MSLVLAFLFIIACLVESEAGVSLVGCGFRFAHFLVDAKKGFVPDVTE
jgi:hypothetical protein